MGQFKNLGKLILYRMSQLYEYDPTRIAGSGDFTVGTAGENLGNRKLVYMGADALWRLADADTALAMPVLAITMNAITAGNRGMFLLRGFIGLNGVSLTPWTWVVGGSIYASATAGELTQTAPVPPDAIQEVGIATDTMLMIFDPAAFTAATSAYVFGHTAYVGVQNALAAHPAYFLCDGIADDVEINAAIAYVSGIGSGSVFLERETYVLASPVTPLSGVNIFGTGWSSLLDGGAICHAIDINNQSNIMIKDIAVQTTAGGGTAFNGVNVRGGSDHIFMTMFGVLQSDNDGIAITNADSDIWVTDAGLGNIDNYGINCDGNDCLIDTCEFHTAIGNDAIYLGANSDGCHVLDNHIHVWTGEPVDDDGDNNVQNNKCSGVGVPIVAWNSKGCGFATIQATIDHQISNGEINIEPGTHTVAGGVITLAAANTGLQIRGAGKLTTTLSSSTRHCIQITAGTNIVIRDLAFRTTGVAVAANGVAILGASTAVFVIDCACIDCDQDAVSVAATASECFIRRNFLSNNIDRFGINNAGDDCIISGNRIINTGADGIWLQAGGTNNIVIENRISGWVGEGIDNDEPTNNVAHNITAV